MSWNTHGMSRSRLYECYWNMKNRVKRRPSGYEKVENLFKDFTEFRTWAIANGYKDNLTLDRINTSGHYSPKNCRWATPKQQVDNRRNTIWVDDVGQRMTQKDFAKSHGITYDTLRYRISKGMTPHEAVLKPKNAQFKTLSESEELRELFGITNHDS